MLPFSSHSTSTPCSAGKFRATAPMLLPQRPSWRFTAERHAARQRRRCQRTEARQRAGQACAYLWTQKEGGGAPFLEVLQYQVDAWSGRSKPLFRLLAPKINLIYGPRVGDVSDIKLIRTDTTLDLSQKAEKRCRTRPGGKAAIPRNVSPARGSRTQTGPLGASRCTTHTATCCGGKCRRDRPCLLVTSRCQQMRFLSCGQLGKRKEIAVAVALDSRLKRCGAPGALAVQTWAQRVPEGEALHSCACRAWRETRCPSVAI